jgi:two-component system, NarL family, sensor histidine kinase UhpB
MPTCRLNCIMPRHRGSTESQILEQQFENRALLERVLSNLEPAMLMHWQSFSSLISQARTLPSIAQIAARAGLEASGARSARVMMLVEDELETLAVANEVGVSSFDGAGLSFETVAFDGAYKESLKKDCLMFESERVIVPLLARDRMVGILEVLGTTQVLAERLRLYTGLIALSLEAATLHTERTRREREARALAELSKRIGETLELEEILERSLEFAVKSLQLERGILALYDDVREQTSIDREFFTFGFEAMSEPSLSISPESFERLVRRNQPILSNDVKASSRSFAAGPRELGAEAFLMLPLSARGKPLGVLYLDTTRASLEIKEREVSLAQALAEQASLAIENARLFDEAVSRGREARVLLQTARLTSATLELEDVLEALANEISTSLELERCFVGFFATVQEDSAEIGRLHAYGFEEDLESFRPFIIAEDAFQQLLEERSPVVQNGAAIDEAWQDQGSALLGAQTCVIVPLTVQGAVIGVLYADTIRPGARLSDRDASLALAIADQAGLAIQNARLFARIQAQESHYRLLAEAAHDLIVTTDLEGIVTYANPATLEVLGFAPSELEGQIFENFLEPDAALAARRAWREMIAGSNDDLHARDAFTFEGGVKRSDGSTAYLEIKLNALRSDGRVVGGLAIARDLSEQLKLADEIAQRGLEARRTDELRSFLALFTQAQEEERRRIARELHDDTAQTLVAIARRLDRLGNSLEKLSIEEAQARTADIRSDVDTAIDSVRRFSRNLRPSTLDDLGLLAALEWLCSQSRTSARLEVSGHEQRLKPDLELTLFRVVQEALTNVDKHAHASSAAIRVMFDAVGNLEHPPGVLVSVTDDGAGFSSTPDADAFTTLAAKGHLGLAGMRERIKLAGGEMKLESEVGLGTKLSFWFPM